MYVMNSKLVNSLQTHTAVRGRPSSTLRCVSQFEHQEIPVPKGEREREREGEREGGRERGREREREGGKERGREGEREREREGEREGGKEGERGREREGVTTKVLEMHSRDLVPSHNDATPAQQVQGPRQDHNTYKPLPYMALLRLVYKHPTFRLTVQL